MRKFDKINLISSVVIMLLLNACVGPAEPDRGLVVNYPEVLNGENSFSYILLGDKYSDNATFKLNFIQNVTEKNYTAFLILTESKSSGENKSKINLLKNNPSVIDTSISLNTNKELVFTKYVITDDELPDSVQFSFESFTGLLEFIMISGNTSSGGVTH